MIYEININGVNISKNDNVIGCVIGEVDDCGVSDMELSVRVRDIDYDLWNGRGMVKHSSILESVGLVTGKDSDTRIRAYTGEDKLTMAYHYRDAFDDYTIAYVRYKVLNVKDYKLSISGGYVTVTISLESEV